MNNLRLCLTKNFSSAITYRAARSSTTYLCKANPIVTKTATASMQTFSQNSEESHKNTNNNTRWQTGKKIALIIASAAIGTAFAGATVLNKKLSDYTVKTYHELIVNTRKLLTDEKTSAKERAISFCNLIGKFSIENQGRIIADILDGGEERKQLAKLIVTVMCEDTVDIFGNFFEILKDCHTSSNLANAKESAELIKRRELNLFHFLDEIIQNFLNQESNVKILSTKQKIIQNKCIFRVLFLIDNVILEQKFFEHLIQTNIMNSLFLKRNFSHTSYENQKDLVFRLLNFTNGRRFIAKCLEETIGERKSLISSDLEHSYTVVDYPFFNVLYQTMKIVENTKQEEILSIILPNSSIRSQVNDVIKFGPDDFLKKNVPELKW